MKRAALLRLALVAISVSTALLVAELALRLQVAAATNLDTQARRSRPSRWPDVVYELKPGLRGLFRGKPLTTNSHGLRGPEVPLAKPQDVFRIVGLGDSHMFGWGVSDDDIYLRRLERALNDRAAGAGGARRFEVLNFAVPGYNTVMQVATFEHKALAFSPDLVIVHFVGNDFAAPHFAEGGAQGPRSYLLAKVREALAAGHEPEDAEPAETRRARRAADRRRYAHLGGQAAYARAMARLGVLCRQRGIPVIVMSLGHAKHPALRAAVRRSGLHFVDAAPRFHSYLAARGLAGPRGAWSRTFRIRRDGHPNPLAHQLFAQVLMEELEALRVIAPSGAVARAR